MQTQDLFRSNNGQYFQVNSSEDAGGLYVRSWLAHLNRELKGSVPSFSFNISYYSRIIVGFLVQVDFDNQPWNVNGLDLSATRCLCNILIQVMKET